MLQTRNCNPNICDDEARCVASTTCNPTYTLSGGIFEDNNEPTGRRTTEPLRAGTIRINNTEYPSGTSGFTVTGLDAGTYTVEYISLPNNYDMTYPLDPSPPPSFNVTVGPNCTESHDQARCSSNNIVDLWFGIRVHSEPWYQTLGGDLRSDNRLVNEIPSGGTCNNTTQAYASATSATLNLNDPGIVFSATTNPNLGGSGDQSGKANARGWLVTGDGFTPARSQTIRTSYAYLKAVSEKGGLRLTSPFGTNSPCGNNGPNCNLQANPSAGAYHTTGNMTITSGGNYQFGGNRDYIFLIQGNLTIQRNISVQEGSTVIFAVGGDITIGPAVTNLEGVFSANNDFIIEAQGTVPHARLNVEGNIIANAGLRNPPGALINERDLGLDNFFCPAFQVTSRLDFVLNAPQVVRYPNYVIQEVAPGPLSDLGR